MERNRVCTHHRQCNGTVFHKSTVDGWHGSFVFFFVRHLFVWNACVIAVLRYILPRGLKSARSQKTSRSVEKRATQPPVRSLSFRISVKAASTTSCSILACKSERFFPSSTSHFAFKPIKCKPLLKDYGYPLGGKGWEKNGTEK